MKAENLLEIGAAVSSSSVNVERSFKEGSLGAGSKCFLTYFRHRGSVGHDKIL